MPFVDFDPIGEGIYRGLQLRSMIENLQIRQPRSLKICALLNKADAREKEVPLAYVGFDIPNEFVVVRIIHGPGGVAMAGSTRPG